MTPYSKTVEKPFVDWRKAVTSCMADKNLINETFAGDKSLGELACNWNTCPVGQHTYLIFRDDDGKPKDTVLADLGNSFTDSFRDENYQNALNILDLIDIRVKHLLTSDKESLTKKIELKGIELKELRKKLKEYTP